MFYCDAVDSISPKLLAKVRVKFEQTCSVKYYSSSFEGVVVAEKHWDFRNFGCVYYDRVTASTGTLVFSRYFICNPESINIECLKSLDLPKGSCYWDNVLV